MIDKIMKERVEHENKLVVDFIVECIMDGFEASEGRTLKIPHGLNTTVYTFSSEYLSKEVVKPKNVEHLKDLLDACKKKVNNLYGNYLNYQLVRAGSYRIPSAHTQYLSDISSAGRLQDFIIKHKPKIVVGVDKAEEGDSIGVVVKSGVDAINEMINTKILDMGKRDSTKKLVSALKNIIATPEKTVEDGEKPHWGNIELWKYPTDTKLKDYKPATRKKGGDGVEIGLMDGTIIGKMPTFDYVLPLRNDDGSWGDDELSRCVWSGIPNSINYKHEDKNTKEQKRMNNENSLIETVNDSKYKELQTKLLKSYNEEDVVDLGFKETNGKKYVEFRLKTSPSKRQVTYKNNLNSIVGAMELLSHLETLIIKNRDDILRIKRGMYTVYNGEELKFNEIINDQSFFFSGLYVKFDNGAVLPYDMLVNQEFKYKL